MRKRFILLTIFFAIFPCFCFSADRSIICDSPEGFRVDYFIINTMNIDNDKFVVAKDKIGNSPLSLIIKENNQSVIFKIGDISSEMKVMLSTSEQITFTGSFNGAPIMATYYLIPDIIIFSQQASWPTGENAGARAFIFYSKCKDEVMKKI